MSTTRPEASAIPLALYIHIPWCVRKCPYCDFNSHNAPQRIPQDEYVDALLADLRQDLPIAGDRRVQSVFFGGGTPSLFSPEAIGRILEGADRLLPFARDAEITLETNPGTVEHGRFDGYRAAGANRISFGIQSFDDDALKRIGRIHDAAEAEQAVRLARAAGFDNFNLDLMYALPDQTLAGALADIDRALALTPTHVSHYQLTLEPNTLFAAHPPPLPDDDAAWDMQEACQARLAEAGYAQYEVSAYAREGRRARHNVNYWRFGDYVGIGAGAHGKLTGADGVMRRAWKLKHPRSYLDAAHSAARVGGDAPIPAEHLAFEFMLNALRLREGFTWRLLTERTGLTRDDIHATLDACLARGWLDVDDEGARASELGWRFLNDVIEAFLPERAG